uniref:Uncharacterized protein n=1 Tax=Mola mola TaxID=94237 RepID=A0A3Q4BF97_MOLML
MLVLKHYIFLQRGESVVEKQVKEARTKCRSIASLLTDAPNPNSKGVLMFKKRRQRAKKYTLTCFGKTEEEGGSSILSGSEVDEAGFSSSFDPTWDTGYLDLLDRRSSACPVVLTPGQHGNPCPDPNLNLGNTPIADLDHHLNATRPFTPGHTPSRPSVTSVMFRPPQPKPVAAVSMVTVQPTCPPSPFCPPTPQPFLSHPAPSYPPPSACVSASPLSPPRPPELTYHVQPTPPSPCQPPASPAVHPYINISGAVNSGPHAAMVAASPLQPTASNTPVTREQRIAVPASRTGILHDARRRSNKKPMFSAVQKQDVSPNPDLMSMVQNMDDPVGRTAGAGHESGPEEDWLRLGAEACNFMQAQRGSRPPPVAPKPQTPQVPQLAGKGGQLFARRQNRMDKYVVERAPSVAAVPYSPGQTREPSPTPSLPATWKYSSNIRAPPPINYNPLLSPSCPLKAQKTPKVTGPVGSKGKKVSKSVDIMSHQPYQLNSSLFSYGGGAPQNPSPYQQQQGMSSGPQKTARVYEVKRFSTPPPTSTGPGLKVIVPRSATTLGEPLWRSDVTSPPIFSPTHYQPQPLQPQRATSLLSPPPPAAPTSSCGYLVLR